MMEHNLFSEQDAEQFERTREICKRLGVTFTFKSNGEAIMSLDSISTLCVICNHPKEIHQTYSGICEKDNCNCKEYETKEVKPVILDDNPISIAKYAEEYPENWKAMTEQKDAHSTNKNLMDKDYANTTNKVGDVK